MPLTFVPPMIKLEPVDVNVIPPVQVCVVPFVRLKVPADPVTDTDVTERVVELDIVAFAPVEANVTTPIPAVVPLESVKVPADPVTENVVAVVAAVFPTVTFVPPDAKETALRELVPVLVKLTEPPVEPDVTVMPPVNVTLLPPANVKAEPVDVMVTRPDGTAVPVFAMRNVPPVPLISMVVAVIVVVLERVTFDPEDVKITGPRTTAPVLLNVTVPVDAAEVVVRPARVTALFENVNEPPVYVLTAVALKAKAPESVIREHPEMFRDVIVVAATRVTVPVLEFASKIAVSAVDGADAPPLPPDVADQ